MGKDKKFFDFQSAPPVKFHLVLSNVSYTLPKPKMLACFSLEAF